MKEIVHKIVCDVCESEHEVDPEVTDLMFSLRFKHKGGLEFDDNMKVGVLKTDVKMDICSIKCLFDYAEKYHKQVVIAEQAAEELKKQSENESIFAHVGNYNFENVDSLETRLRKDGALPPPPEVIDRMINKEELDPEYGRRDFPILEPKPQTITGNVGRGYGYDTLIKEEAEQKQQDIMAELDAIIEESTDEPMITLSQSYYMIVKMEKGQLFIGNSTRPVPLDTCIEFDAYMIVFPTFDDAVIYRDKNMVTSPTIKIVEVICDPIDYHSNDGRIKYCLFPSK
jgi:hypothetical protein